MLWSRLNKFLQCVLESTSYFLFLLNFYNKWMQLEKLHPSKVRMGSVFIGSIFYNCCALPYIIDIFLECLLSVH